RRRHTSFSRDWSSDVCSSDLLLLHREEESATDVRLAQVPRQLGVRDDGGLDHSRLAVLDLPLVLEHRDRGDSLRPSGTVLRTLRGVLIEERVAGVRVERLRLHEKSNSRLVVSRLEVVPATLRAAALVRGEVVKCHVCASSLLLLLAVLVRRRDQGWSRCTPTRTGSRSSARYRLR